MGLGGGGAGPPSPSVPESIPCLDSLQSTQKSPRRLSRNEIGVARCARRCENLVPAAPSALWEWRWGSKGREVQKGVLNIQHPGSSFPPVLALP